MPMESWSQAPVCVLEQILHRLDPHDRLLKCCLVNRHWSAAAVVSTRSIDVFADAPESKRIGVLKWLDKHGLLLSQLKLYGGHSLVMASLPCPGLRELLIHGFHLQLTPRGGQPGLLHAATGLTQLVLLRATVLGGSQQLTALSVLTDLQHLVLSELQEPSLQYAAIPGCLLSHLQQLTHMQIVSGLSDAALQHLSRLTNLQQLQLERLGADTTPAALAHVALLQQLTSLLLEGAHFTLGDVSTPSVAALTGLSVLQLHACNSMEPGLLSTLTSLHVLQLKLTPLEGAAEGAEQLLALLPKLRQLTALELHAALVQEAPSASAYSALTANSKLQALQLSSAQLPAGAWDAMFPAHGLQAPAQLTFLRLAYCEEQLGEKALEGLVRCCPKLESFHLSGRAQLGWSLTQLRQLSALTELGLSHVTDEVAGKVAQLPGLSSLLFVQPSSVSDRGVLQLTELQRLTYLWVASEGLSREMGTPGNRTMLQLTHQESGDLGPVYMQLLDRWLCTPAGQRQVMLDIGMCLGPTFQQQRFPQGPQEDDGATEETDVQQLSDQLHGLLQGAPGADADAAPFGADAAVELRG